MFEKFWSPDYGKLSIIYLYTIYSDCFLFKYSNFRLNQWLIYKMNIKLFFKMLMYVTIRGHTNIHFYLHLKWETNQIF